MSTVTHEARDQRQPHCGLRIYFEFLSKFLSVLALLCAFWRNSSVRTSERIFYQQSSPLFMPLHMTPNTEPQSVCGLLDS